MTEGTVLGRLPVLKSVVTAIATDTSRPARIGKTTFILDDAGQPTDKPDLPCSVVYGGAGTELDGPPFGGAHTDMWLPVLIRAVGRRPDQVEWLGDAIRSAMLDQLASGAYRVAIAGDGFRVGGRELSSDGPLDAGGNVWSATHTYRLWITPASD
jgi:hypothetical protein